jgi:pyruvate-ferredoxin/flavodoxin oxidoreductase
MSKGNTSRNMVTIDGNTAAAQVAHALSEVIAIYPITPSSPMGELADELSVAGVTNIWGTLPDVTEMQSEAGASGAVHGALTTGALTTTFTASQGLLLMIPNMYKIAGELIPTVFHVSARSLATHALSIFGDHSDVMAVRGTGFALLASGSIQEVHDLALIAHGSTLESRVPFVHFFDGFRSSHEIQKIEELTQDDMRAVIEEKYVLEHRMRGMSPDHPVLRGTAQNPDVFFQGRETVNPYYLAAPGIVQKVMDRFAQVVGRQYHLFDYFGAPDAENVVVLMGSGAEAAHEVVDYLNAHGEKVGVVKVRLFRPFVGEALIAAIPATVKRIAVLDRTKEPGAVGEPLYQDVVTAFSEAYASGNVKSLPLIVGGRYGLGSKEFNAGMAKSVFDNLATDKPKSHFTVGIVDDVTFTSLDWDKSFSAEAETVHRAMFFGLGSDGTVGANKNSIKIIGKGTENYVQGYFVYDSKKSGTWTASHLRFSPRPIRSTYVIDKAGFLACHNSTFLEQIDMLSHLRENGVFLLNSPYGADEVWDHLPREVQRQIIDRKARFYVIDGNSIAKSVGLGGRINIIMQAAFFKISGVLPEDQAMHMIEVAVEDTYGRKGGMVVDMNIRGAEIAVERIQRVEYPQTVTSTLTMRAGVSARAPEFVQEVTGEIIAGRGDDLPVSVMPVDGTFPTGTTQYEKRNIATEIPVWDFNACIQCNQCAFVCPHATIRAKVYPAELANGQSPATFKSMEAKGKEWKGMKYTLQVSPLDCTGCGVCVEMCPSYAKDETGKKTERKAINMAPLTDDLRQGESENWEYFVTLPNTDPATFNRFTVKGSQMLQPLFEFSGACAGCGETPYVKLVSQLFGDRAIIANATGCSSIYGGNLPTTPYARRPDGRGPTWSNSLFEDAAEFGMGMRLTVDKLTQYAHELLNRLIEAADNHVDLLTAIRDADMSAQEGIEEQRGRVDELKNLLQQDGGPLAQQLLSVADYLVKKSVWVFGGDGWAYDIGYGGLDHVLASGRNVNVLVLDTGVYSNTGGQMSKATPRGAVAKFAAAGKGMPKKDLGMIAMTYGNIYVAQVALGTNMNQCVKAFAEAEAYHGPSLVIAYSQCINHGYDLRQGYDVQKDAVECGFWPLFRFNPDNARAGKQPLTLDSKAPTKDVEEWMYRENRFRILRNADPERAQQLLDLLREDVITRWKMYEQWAQFEI